MDLFSMMQMRINKKCLKSSLCCDLMYKKLQKHNKRVVFKSACISSPVCLKKSAQRKVNAAEFMDMFPKK